MKDVSLLRPSTSTPVPQSIAAAQFSLEYADFIQQSFFSVCLFVSFFFQKLNKSCKSSITHSLQSAIPLSPPIRPLGFGTGSVSNIQQRLLPTEIHRKRIWPLCAFQCPIFAFSAPISASLGQGGWGSRRCPSTTFKGTQGSASHMSPHSSAVPVLMALHCCYLVGSGCP